VHWVDPNTESAWMSLHSPYADMFLERIKKIAATGIDGIWLDVPIYNDIGAPWSDTSPGAAEKFRADTGMEVPKAVNWSDPVWRRRIAWRYQEIFQFPAARARYRAIGDQGHQHRRRDRDARLRRRHHAGPRREHHEDRSRHDPGLGGRRGQRQDRHARGQARRLDQPDRHVEIRQGCVGQEAVVDLHLRQGAG